MKITYLYVVTGSDPVKKVPNPTGRKSPDSDPHCCFYPWNLRIKNTYVSNELSVNCYQSGHDALPLPPILPVSFAVVHHHALGKYLQYFILQLILLFRCLNYVNYQCLPIAKRPNVSNVPKMGQDFLDIHSNHTVFQMA